MGIFSFGKWPKCPNNISNYVARIKTGNTGNITFKLYPFFFLINLFIYLFLAVLGLCCCMRAFSSCGERGLLFIEVCGLLIAVASLVAEHGLRSCGSAGFNSCGTWAQ